MPAARLTATLAAAATVALAGPAAAQAANPYTPQQICGAGYVIAEVGGRPAINKSNPYAWGYLMRKPGTQQYCTTSIKRQFVGRPSWIGVRVNQWYGGNYRDRDAGNFRYYAGPLRFDAAGDTCFDVKGTVGNGKGRLIPMGFGGVGPCRVD